ncbi:MAG TPA: methyltransferase domain-containing protein [Thermoleophilaceae bacterium]|jgi:predicted nicotinamide N-methyase
MAAADPLAAPPDPLRASLREQLVRMRGGGSALPEALLDVVREELAFGGEPVTVIRPRDWEELRHQYGASGTPAPYWATTWPSGLALADALEGRALAGRRVLELGCGLGIPSLVAARMGARVLATDGSPDAVAFAAHNLALNDAVGEVARADWCDGPLSGGPWDLVLAADVLYLPRNVDALLRLLPDLMAPGATAIVADPQRAGGRAFVAAARKIFRLETRADRERPSVELHTLRLRR